jgi:hypothetical protein
MTSVQVPLIYGNFPEEIQSDMSQCMGLDRTQMIHENTKKCTGAYSFKVLGSMFDDVIENFLQKDWNISGFENFSCL